MEAINYAHGGQNMILTEDAQIVPGVSGNACYLPAGTGTIALQGNRNELSVSLWRQWDGVVESGAVRGIFRFKNIRVFFDTISDCLTIVINGFKAITDIKDDQNQAHWCFTFAKNNRLTVYKNGKEVYSLAAGNKPVETADGFIIGGGRTHATFDEVRVYKTVLKQGEINGLFYLVSKGTQVKQLEKIVQSATPKYLGVTKTVPTTRTVVITKGEKLGAQDANAGDWVLMSKTVGGWKVGVCYRWTGTLWVNLEPEYNYTEQYQAALYHICEIEELMQNTGHFGALFAKVLVAQKALIDKLVVQEAFIKQLATEQAFLKKLVVQKLHIDSDPKSHQDFEAWFDETNGLKIKNKGQEIFKVDTAGNVFAKNATLADGVFTGSILSGPVEFINQEPASKKLLFGKNIRVDEYFKAYGNIKYFGSGSYKEKKIWMITLGYSGDDGYFDYTLTCYGDQLHHVFDLRYHGRLYDDGWKTWMDERLEEDFIFHVNKGTRTLKLKDIPKSPPEEKNVVWRDEQGFLHLS